MLIIKPIQDKEYQQTVCKECGFEYDSSLFAYSAKIDEQLIAACQFDIFGKNASITHFGMTANAEEDIEALIILGRAVLNFLDLTGVKTCTFDSTLDTSDKYAKMLGFKAQDNKKIILLEGLFDAKCSHDK